MVLYNQADPRDGRGPMIEISYESCDPSHMFDHQEGFDGIGSTNPHITWEVELPVDRARQVEEVVLGISRDDYVEVARKNDYTSVTSAVRRYDLGYKFTAEKCIPVERFLYTRDQFLGDIRNQVSNSKENQ